MALGRRAVRPVGRGARVVALLLATACCGCGGSGDSGKPAPAPSKPLPPARGVVTGVVRLTPGADLPEYSTEATERKILSHTERAAMPEMCSPPKLSDHQPVQLTPDGLLVGVMLAASGFSTQPEVAPMVREVKIEDCRLTPRLITAKKGDTLRVINTVNYPFMPAYGETTLVKTLIPGQNYDVPLDKPGVSAVTCGFTALCGRTDVVVLEHPFHTVTDDKGHFRIENFPADEPVTLNAWHPLFKEAKIELTLGRGEERKVELVLEPATPPPAPPTPAAPEPAAPKPHKAAGKAPATKAE